MLEQILCPKDLTEDDFAHANCGHCIEFSPKLIKDGGVLYAKISLLVCTESFHVLSKTCFAYNAFSMTLISSS